MSPSTIPSKKYVYGVPVLITGRRIQVQNPLREFVALCRHFVFFLRQIPYLQSIEMTAVQILGKKEFTRLVPRVFLKSWLNPRHFTGNPTASPIKDFSFECYNRLDQSMTGKCHLLIMERRLIHNGKQGIAKLMELHLINLFTHYNSPILGYTPG